MRTNKSVTAALICVVSSGCDGPTGVIPGEENPPPQFERVSSSHYQIVLASGGYWDCHWVEDPPGDDPIMTGIETGTPLNDVIANGWECHYVPGPDEYPTPDPIDGGWGPEKTPPTSHWDGDFVATAPPDCSKPQTDVKLQAYCDGWHPVGADSVAIQASLQRLRSRGSVCAQLADAAQQLINQKRFRIFKFTEDMDFSALAALGGDFAAIGDVWLLYWQDRTTENGLNLDGIIAHEMDHHLNNGQAGLTNKDGHYLRSADNPDPDHTLNSRMCAGAGSPAT